MLRSAIDRHKTSLKMLLEVSILAQPRVDWRISRRCASRPGKNRFSLDLGGWLQETETNSELVWCGASSQCQVAVLTDSRVGRGSKCNAVARVTPSSPRYS